mmetsp:Transcript_83557/g.218259  ORF Transcript_83557/g.218259 Transcript_83557/m.218259 type:complete len:315 (+) Transcript_83557:526-1470(+)
MDAPEYRFGESRPLLPDRAAIFAADQPQVAQAAGGGVGRVSRDVHAAGVYGRGHPRGQAGQVLLLRRAAVAVGPPAGVGAGQPPLDARGELLEVAPGARGPRLRGPAALSGARQGAGSRLQEAHRAGGGAFQARLPTGAGRGGLKEVRLRPAVPHPAREGRPPVRRAAPRGPGDHEGGRARRAVRQVVPVSVPLVRPAHAHLRVDRKVALPAHASAAGTCLGARVRLPCAGNAARCAGRAPRVHEVTREADVPAPVARDQLPGGAGAVHAEQRRQVRGARWPPLPGLPGQAHERQCEGERGGALAVRVARPVQG